MTCCVINKIIIIQWSRHIPLEIRVMYFLLRRCTNVFLFWADHDESGCAFAAVNEWTKVEYGKRLMGGHN